MTGSSGPEFFGSRSRGRGVHAAAFANLDAAVALDQAVNGTSLLFPGDAQWGTWAAAMKDPAWTDLLRTVRFYKVGHHASESATPRQFVEGLLPDAPWTMTSTLERPQWKNLTKVELLEALSRKHAVLVRSDEDAAAPAGAHGFQVEHGVVVEVRIHDRVSDHAVRIGGALGRHRPRPLRRRLQGDP